MDTFFAILHSRMCPLAIPPMWSVDQPLPWLLASISPMISVAEAAVHGTKVQPSEHAPRYWYRTRMGLPVRTEYAVNSSPPCGQPALLPWPLTQSYGVPQTTVPPSGVRCIVQQVEAPESGTVSRARLAVIRPVPEPVAWSVRSRPEKTSSEVL